MAHDDLKDTAECSVLAQSGHKRPARLPEGDSTKEPDRNWYSGRWGLGPVIAARCCVAHSREVIPYGPRGV